MGERELERERELARAKERARKEARANKKERRQRGRVNLCVSVFIVFFCIHVCACRYV